MTGLAKTSKFLLSTATVMLGAPADLNDFKPSVNAIGLVKNFRFNTEPSYTELTQGVKGSVVDSVMTSNPVKASMEVYEYTSANLAYGLGLNGSSLAAVTTNTTVSTAVSSTPQATLVVTSASGLTAGDYIMIEVDTIDNLVIRKIASISSNTLTLAANVANIPLNAKVYKTNSIEVGSKENQPFLAARVVGKTTDGDWLAMNMCKVRITKGFDIAFTGTDFSNLPFEFQIYDLAASDAGYAEYGASGCKIFTRA